MPDAFALDVAIAVRELHAAAVPAELAHGQHGLGDVASQHVDFSRVAGGQLDGNLLEAVVGDDVLLHVAHDHVPCTVAVGIDMLGEGGGACEHLRAGVHEEADVACPRRHAETVDSQHPP
eukprot:8139916-Alexandrium_andersonii.AAC.1